MSVDGEGRHGVDTLVPGQTKWTKLRVYFNVQSRRMSRKISTPDPDSREAVYEHVISII